MDAATLAADDALAGLGEVIDAHTHVDEVPALGWVDPPEKLVALLDEAGISRAVVMTYTEAPQFNARALDHLAEAVARFPDRLVGFARVHPWYDEAPRLLERAITEHGMKGLKLHPVGTLDHPGSPATVRLLRLAGERGAPALFHCGDEPMTTPTAIAAGAVQAPDTTVILGHMGGYLHVDEAIRVAERHPNIVLETSAMPYPDKIRAAVDRIGPDRVVYGSDGPGCPPRLELRKVLAAGLSEAERRLVLHDNMQRLFDRVVH
jgi:predicted TIM-barrel fold metal-dependent hydrolase